MSSIDHYPEAELDTQADPAIQEEYGQEHYENRDEPLADTNALQPTAHLPLALTVRCGHLTLSLDELHRLGHGTVLEVQGIAPGYATLCHGDHIVAEGELVDVDGRLGLQLIRMASRS